MNKDLTDVTILLDRSVSMADITEETIAGFNEVIREQKLVPGLCNVSLVQFARDYDPTFTALALGLVPVLTPMHYQANGSSTRYLDSLARVIDETGQRLANTPEEHRPGKVILIAITDGEENDSQVYKRKEDGWDRVAAKRKHQEEKYNWTITIIGQDFNPTEAASKLGVAANNSAVTSKHNTRGTYKGISRGLKSYRGQEHGHVDNFALLMGEDEGAKTKSTT